MRRSIVCAALVAAVGCSSSARTKETAVYQMSAESLGVATPAAAPSSACGGEAACRAACDRGDAIYARDPAAGRRLYQRACASGDPRGCGRMVEESAGDLASGDRFARLACDGGDARSCALLGLWSTLATIAPRPGEDRDGLRTVALAASERACAAGHYRACQLPAVLHSAEGDAAKAEVALDRARAVAGAGCDRGDRVACAFVDREPPAAATAREKVVAQTATEAKRVSGFLAVQPSPGEKKRMAALRRPGVAVFKICLSERGGVASVSPLRLSPHVNWNRRLVESMRGWRYTPFMVGDRPVPVCTSVTFIYRPR